MEGSIFKQQEQANEEQHYESSGGSCGCGGCFRLFRFKPLRAGEKRHVLGETAASFVGKMRELSEMVAGPKWKNFRRRVGGYFRGTKKYNNTTRFQYDPQSYALNFDSGLAREEDQENGPLLR